MRCLPSCCALVFVAGVLQAAGEIGFDEDFVLADDRAEALKQLVPGTDQHYYYTCLQRQHEGRLDDVDELVERWEKQRRQTTAEAWEIRYRQALLRYDQNPQQSLAFIRDRLGLRFDHQQETLTPDPRLPTSLDQALISRQHFWREALASYGDVNDIEDSGLDWLLTQELDADRLRRLLQRLQRPDFPGLAKLVIDDLKHPNSRGFGSMPIHLAMTLEQLGECETLMPELLGNANFVHAWLSKLQPPADVDLDANPAAREAHLERMWGFVGRLAPAHNSLKAHVLYHRLDHDRRVGVYDRDRFVAYLKLPRQIHYVSRAYLQQGKFRDYVNLSDVLQPVTLLPPIGVDEPLVREYLMHFFVDDADYQGFAKFIEDSYLKPLFAETKLLYGKGDPEQWYALLPPTQLKLISDRVELSFAATNREFIGTDEPVELALEVKNIETLIVKVFKLNALNFYRTNGQEIGTAVNLDGLVANDEQVYTYDAPPIRRQRRTYAFPQIKDRGVYVCEFIGNGISSRALIRKGALRLLERRGTAGQVVTVLNEDQQTVAGCTIQLGGQSYATDADGQGLIPYSSQPGAKQLILDDGQLAVLQPFQHVAESYILTAGFHVEREQLLSRGEAQLVVRPVLLAHGTPVTLSVLQDIHLTVSSTDRDGVSTTADVAVPILTEAAEYVHTFQVPERLATIGFTLRAKVKLLSSNTEQTLTAGRAVQVNAIDATDQVDDLHLSRSHDGYGLDVLGKSGEPRGKQPVVLVLKHRDFRHPITVQLQSNGAGRIQLGALADIEEVRTAHGSGRLWRLQPDRDARLPAVVHGRAGEPVRIAYTGDADGPVREELCLLARNRDTYTQDDFASLQLNAGCIELADLAAGDYELFLKSSQQSVTVSIAEGEVRAGYILGRYRQLERAAEAPLAIADVAVTEDALAIHLTGASPVTRVHLAACRYLPPFTMFPALGVAAPPALQRLPLRRPRSFFVSARDIGDEYRYILERRYADRYPGNLLGRPSLLLNPWAIRDTQTQTQQAAEGGSYTDLREAEAVLEGQSAALGSTALAAETDFGNLDFLPAGAVILTNLQADADGVVQIPREQLGDGQQLSILAVSPTQTVSRQLTLPEREMEPRDLRLLTPLQADAHLTEKKQISAVLAGARFELADIGTSSFELYDSLARVHALYTTLSDDENLRTFSFVLQWPELETAEKQKKYAEYACHELNFFIYRKDPAFFETVVQPYLRSKRDKTFIDDWLIGADLTGYLEPWAYARLNIVEQILLSARLADERPPTRRHVDDLFELLPLDRDRFNQLFDTAIRGRALETGDALGFAKAKGAELQQRSREFAKKEQASLRRQAANGALAAAAVLRDADKAAAPSERSVRKRAESRAVLDVEKAAGFFAADRKAPAVQQLYRQLDTTKEWAENNYYQLPIEQQLASLVSVNAFWRDYAAHGEGPFYSTNLAVCTGNFTEMMFALSVLDLPFAAAEHQPTYAGARLQLTVGSPAVVFHKQIQAAALETDQVAVLVSEDFFRRDDRYQQVDNQRLDKWVRDEFLVHTVYGCQVVVTNPSGAPQELTLLLQLPAGAVPVLASRYTRSVNLALQPYHTQNLEYFFYFPTTGSFSHFPVHVARAEQIVAFAPPRTLKVVRELTQIDRTSWPYLSQHGSNEEVLGFLRTQNVHRYALQKIAFRMKDKAFFKQATTLLQQRHVFDPVLWSYGLLHGDTETARTFVEHSPAYLQQCGLSIDTPLLTIDPVRRHTYQHFEYSPLINARAHQLGRERRILNDRFHEQYQAFLAMLRYHPKLTDDDLLGVVYYLFLQDRVSEGLKFFDRIDRARLAAHLQYDYLAAYAAFFRGDTDAAAALIAPYLDHGVPRWRQRFALVRAQLDEIAGRGGAKVVDDRDRQQLQQQLAAAEPNLNFTVEGKTITLDHRNLDSVTVNYYLMDVELLFSRSPFVQQDSGHFAYIQPNATAVIDLAAAAEVTRFELPEALQSSNVMIEVIGGEARQTLANYANNLRVSFVSNYGQLTVSDKNTGAPLPGAYVKVYARLHNDEVRFYKDGYTDLRGRFDVTSLSTNELDQVARFALLVMHDTRGAVIREFEPPQR